MSEGHRPDVSVIVVSHDHADFLGPCLDALAADAAAGSIEVLVVDNASDDDSAAVAARRDWVRLFVNEERQGFSANHNLGMAHARGRYALLLNPDTEVEPSAIATLVGYMDATPQAGLAGACLVGTDGAVQPSARRFPDVRTFLARRTPLRRVLARSSWNRRHLMLDDSAPGSGPVDWLLGACLMVRWEAVDDVGPLDEGYRLYVEDIDWARRMHDGGWEVHYVPAARIVHHHQGVSDRRFLTRHSWYHFRSIVRYARKHFPPRVPGWSIRSSRRDVWSAHRH